VVNLVIVQSIFCTNFLGHFFAQQTCEDGRGCSKYGKPGEVGEWHDFEEKWNVEVIIEPFIAF
jgi:hypothetical protein